MDCHLDHVLQTRRQHKANDLSTFLGAQSWPELSAILGPIFFLTIALSSLLHTELLDQVWNTRGSQVWDANFIAAILEISNLIHGAWGEAIGFLLTTKHIVKILQE